MDLKGHLGYFLFEFALNDNNYLEHKLYSQRSVLCLSKWDVKHIGVSVLLRSTLKQNEGFNRCNQSIKPLFECTLYFCYLTHI